MSHSFIKGASSLFLSIAAIKAIYSSKLILWKISTCLIVPISYLCNAYDYKPPYLMLDYIMITFVSSSYINHFKINSLITALALCEYYNNNTIDTVKNITYAIGTVKAIYITYYLKESYYFYMILLSSISGMSIYNIRYSLIKKNNNTYSLLLTYLMHICAMNIMYVSSITAI
jgi:hypothetical protein